MLDPAVLKTTYLVVGLTDDQIAQLAALAELKLYQSGQLITRIGETECRLYVLLEGRALALTADGDRLGEIAPGSLIGEIQFVDGGASVANVSASGRASAAVFDGPALRRLMSQNRDWGFTMLANISRVLSGRLRQADAAIDELSDRAQDVWHNAMN